MKEHQIAPHRSSWLGRILALWSVTSSLFVGLVSLSANAQDNGAPPDTAPPLISGFDPTTGAAGTEVTISGDHLAGATAVQFNGQVASFHEGFSGQTLLATVPAGATTGPITVLTPAGSASSAEAFTVTVALPPTITGFSPESGPVGTPVVINGDNLSTATSVNFNGVAAQFTLFGNTVTAYVPQGAATGPISILSPGGSGTSAKAFVVTTASGAPVITDVTPSSGRPGDRVTISGDNLLSATTLRFNGVSAEFSVFGFSLFATVPDGASSGLISVVTPNGSAQSPGVFSVIDPRAPGITAFTPNAGAPGTRVTITGTNLVSVSEVRFGGATAEFTIVSGAELQATVPPGATTASLTVSTPAGTAVSSEPFYVEAQILTFTPAHGPVGTSVTIKGVNFTGAIAVLFGSANATFTNVSPTEIHATVPEGAVTGVISLATPAGFVRTDTNFFLPPRIVAVNPRSGPVATDVAILGENLLGTTSVRFGGTEASFSSATLTSITVPVPPLAQDGPITVTTPGGSAVSPDVFYIGSFADLSVDQTANAVGSFVSYALRVSNRGPLEATAVQLQDQLPTGVSLLFPPTGAECFQTNDLITCQLGTVPSGGDVNIRLSASAAGVWYLTNQVSLTTTSADPNLADNSSSVVTILDGAPPLVTNVFLAFAVVGSALQVSWPVEAEGYMLESTPTLTSPFQWTVVPGVPVVVNGQNTVAFPLSSAPGFLRLRKP